MSTTTQEPKQAPPAEIKTMEDLYSALKAEVTGGIDKNADRVEALSKRFDEIQEEMKEARRAAAIPPDGIDYKATGDPEKDYSWFKVIGAIQDEAAGRKGWTDERKKGPTYELTMEATEKMQLAGTDSAGGYAVPAQVFIDQIIPALEARAVMLAAGAQLIDNLVGSPVEWPKITSLLSGYWVEEGIDITEDEIAMGQMSLTPHGLGALVNLTNRLMRQSSGRAETAVRNHITTALARTLDLAIFKGTGGKAQPVGIVSHAGVNSVDASTYGALFTSGATNQVQEFLDAMVGTIEDDDALLETPVWFMNPAARRKFFGVKDSTGRPLLFDGTAAAGAAPQPVNSRGADRFFGYEYFTSTQLAKGSNADLILAQPQEVIVGQWGSLMLEADRSLGFKNSTTWIKGTMEVDVGLMHGESVCEATNLTI